MQVKSANREKLLIRARALVRRQWSGAIRHGSSIYRGQLVHDRRNTLAKSAEGLDRPVEDAQHEPTGADVVTSHVQEIHVAHVENC